jgi:tetratricopeptide (TPR) repeat protein
MRKGDVLVASRQMREAAEAYGRSKAMRESAGDEFGLAECDYSMAQLMAAEGRMDEAVDMHVSALEMRRRIGDRMGVVESLGRLGACMGHYGDFDRALEYFDECLVMMRDGNDRVREGKCLVNMGTTYAEVRHDEGTHDLHHLAIGDTIGQRLFVPWTLRNSAPIKRVLLRIHVFPSFSFVLSRACLYLTRALHAGW